MKGVSLFPLWRWGKLRPRAVEWLTQERKGNLMIGAAWTEDARPPSQSTFPGLDLRITPGALAHPSLVWTVMELRVGLSAITCKPGSRLPLSLWPLEGQRHHSHSTEEETEAWVGCTTCWGLGLSVWCSHLQRIHWGENCDPQITMTEAGPIGWAQMASRMWGEGSKEKNSASPLGAWGRFTRHFRQTEELGAGWGEEGPSGHRLVEGGPGASRRREPSPGVRPGMSWRHTPLLTCVSQGSVET